MLAIGPDVMQLAFGDKFSYDRVGLAIVAVGMGFYLSAAALNQAALAQGQARRAALCWLTCAGAFVVWNLIAPLDPYRTVEVGFTGSAALLSGLLYLLYAQPHPVAADSVEPGSPQEIEARLAAKREDVAELFPLDRRGGLGGEVEGDAVDVRDLVDDPARDSLEQVVRQSGPVSGHRVLGGDRADHDRIGIGAAVALDPGRANDG